MGDGAKRRAPCGHMGEVVIGTYVACKKCDGSATPTTIEPEKTQPFRAPWRDPGKCPRCASEYTEYFVTEIDGLAWYVNLPPYMSSFPPEAGDCGCNTCGKTWTP